MNYILLKTFINIQILNLTKLANKVRRDMINYILRLSPTILLSIPCNHPLHPHQHLIPCCNTPTLLPSLVPTLPLCCRLLSISAPRNSIHQHNK